MLLRICYHNAVLCHIDCKLTHPILVEEAGDDTRDILIGQLPVKYESPVELSPINLLCILIVNEVLLVLNKRHIAKTACLCTIREKHDKLLFAFFKRSTIAQVHVTTHSYSTQESYLREAKD